MPEGPEIRRAADKVAKAVAGHSIESVVLNHPELIGHDNLFLGHRVDEIRTRGKAMLTRLSSGWSIYSHNQLYGRWSVSLKTTAPRLNRSLRLAITAGRHTVRLWSATDIELIRTEDEEQHPFIRNLGPDVLDRKVNDKVLAEQLMSKQCRGRKAASLMLDQHAFAGLGNYLRSEILFVSGIHPDRRPCDLDEEQLRRWAKNIRKIARRTYRTGGVTVDEESARKGKQSGQPRSTWRHYVFAREGQACPNCGEVIGLKRYGGRRLNYCPACQNS